MKQDFKFKFCKLKFIYALVALTVLFGVGYKIFTYDYYDRLTTISETGIKKISLEVKEITSSVHNIKAYLLEDKTNPIVSMSFRFKNGGYASDDDNKKGLSMLAASLLGEGAGDLSSQELKEKLKIKGIKISFSVDKDDFLGNLLTTKDNLSDAVELLGLILKKPRFDDEDIKRNKKIMYEALRRQNEHPINELKLVFAQELYGNHPYSRNWLGDENDIKQITANDLLNFTKNVLNQKSLIVGIAGDVDAKQVSNILDKIFGAISINGEINLVKNANIDFAGQNKQITRQSGQNVWIAAMQGLERNHKDFYPLFVANHIWGGAGLNSKLSQQIREKEGLTYGIYSYLSLNDKAPLIIINFSATPDNFVKAKKLWKQQTVEFQKHGITKKELDKAKKYLLASYNLRFVSISSIADILVAMQKYNLGLDFLQKRNENIANITIEEVNDAIQKYFNPEKIVEAEIGIF